MSKATILIIEDDDSHRRVLEYNLNKTGYLVLSASDGEKGLNLFRNNIVDVVLTDLKMPGMDGLEVLERIKKSDSEIIIIIITAYATIEKAATAMKKGAFAYITKPFNREDLFHIIDRGLKMKNPKKENLNLGLELKDKLKLENIVGPSP